MLLFGAAIAPGEHAAIADFAGRSDAFSRRGADILVLVPLAAAYQVAQHFPDGLSGKLVVCDDAYPGRCGVAPNEAVVFVVDRNRRVILRKPYVAGEDFIAPCLDGIARLPVESPREVSVLAPLLMIPNLLPAAVCQFLVDQFDTRPTFESEVASADLAGKPQSRVDHVKKMRRDLFLAEEEPLHAFLCEAILRRAAPEMARAFHARVAHVDRLLVARYEANAGWFHRHRDNVARHVAFREFAVSINLGAEPFEGGDLMFPEYNDHHYRPPLGAALVFSGSLLHQVTPVTAGRRTALLTFLYSDAAEARRLAGLAEASA
jgi:predicted 2-oxoglutarate/Fe(II)-dependent dioxygenase YbiX